MDTTDRIEDFAIGMACALRKAKKEVRFAGSDAARRTAAEAEVAKARKSFLQAIRMYRESQGVKS